MIKSPLSLILAACIVLQASYGLCSKIYFVGVGPAGPDLCTLQALKIIKRSDVVYAQPLMMNLFSKYTRGKDRRNPHIERAYSLNGVHYTKLKGKDLAKQISQKDQWARKLIAEIKDEVKKGRDVAYLAQGDPCLYGDLGYLLEHLADDEFDIIPGMSAWSAGAALLKMELTKTGKGRSPTVIISTPMGDELKVKPSTADLAKHQTTMVLFMAGGKLPELIGDLSKHYSKDTPVAVCYYIGFPGREEVIRGTLTDIVAKLGKERKAEMAMVYVGDFLR